MRPVCGAIRTLPVEGEMQTLACELHAGHLETHLAICVAGETVMNVRFTGDDRVWIVAGPDGCYGLYATEGLARQHVLRMADPDEFTVEFDIVRTELLPEVAAL